MDFVVPAFEKRPWPTLGPEVARFIEDSLVFGPGDLRGQPARLDDEQRALIYRMYEVHPRGSPRQGKRRFQRVCISLRKGLRKTELAAWLAAVELHPEGPVRCDGFRRQGRTWVPVGRPVTDPYIPLVAYTEEQSEDLAYGALLAMLSEDSCRIGGDFDLGLERIMRRDGRGKAVALANAPDARDGARTTWEHFDETHRFTLPRLREAHKTMLANLLKRPIADPWALETTTMYAPGEGSVAEGTHDYARKVHSGDIENPRLFYFHRQASPKHDLASEQGLLAAINEASGIASEWSDVEGIAAQWGEPDADLSFLARVWLNMPMRATAKAFDAEKWKALAKPHDVPAGALITIGFDGSRSLDRDRTALVATEVQTGYQWPVGIWTPRALSDDDDWTREVDTAVEACFEKWTVWRLYADPPYWETNVAAWAGRFGRERVTEWWTARERAIGHAVRAFANAIADGDISHSGDPLLSEHIGNAHRRYVAARDDQGERLWTITKERGDSPHKIDGAMAAVLSWEARNDAIAAGAQAEETDYEPPEPAFVDWE